MYVDLDLNLATFQYIDGFGCYHFYFGIDGILLNFFANFGSALGLQVLY